MIDASSVWVDRIDMGGWPVPGTNLGAAGYSLLVICVAEELADRGYPSERQTARWYNCATLHAPFIDGPITQEVTEQAERAATAVVREIERGGKVLVTCFEGRNRSGLVIALALLKMFPVMSSNAVIRLIRNRRWAPSGYSALSNLEFVDYIEHWRDGHRVGHGRVA